MVSFPRFDKSEAEKNPEKQELSTAAPFEAADLIVSYLEQLGVEYVFGIPGGPIEPLYNALARSARRGGPRPIVARHESGAAFMADGYARETGKLGVCCATTGPGATNMLTGIASAQQDNTPLLVITAQSPLPTFGRGAAQESSCDGINTVEILRYCTKYSSLVSHIDQLEWKLAAAIIAACQEPQGPAHLSIPLDLLRAPFPFSKPSHDLSSLTRPISYSDTDALEQLLKRVEVSQKMVIVVGERCRDAIDIIADLAALLGATIVATPQGKGLINPYNPNFRGVFGLAGHKSATWAITDPKVDLIIAAGSKLDELSTNGWDESALMTDKLVHIDSHAHYFSRSPMAKLHVCGNISAIFAALYKSAVGRDNPRRTLIDVNAEIKNHNIVKFERRQKERRCSNAEERLRQPKEAEVDRRLNDRRQGINRGYTALRHFKCNDEHKLYDKSLPIKPQRLMFDLSRLFPSDTRYAADIGNSFLWAIHYLHPYKKKIPGRKDDNANFLVTGMGFSSMGWAIGAAIGIALGSKDSPVLCITGDGSFLMNGQEITVAISESLRVILVILNDASLGTVRHGQRLAGAEVIGYELPRIDYAAMAKAMGIRAFSIRSPEDLSSLDIRGLCEQPGPTLLDIHIDPNESPPLGERLEMLASGR